MKMKWFKNELEVRLNCEDRGRVYYDENGYYDTHAKCKGILHIIIKDDTVKYACPKCLVVVADKNE